MNSLELDIKALANHETFARFIEVIHSLREETISEMHNADVDKLQQLSGRIITYDQIIQMADWQQLKVRHQQSLNN
jgi:hypothetical protein|tara:strand:- start:1556 stop:1783 length:228 start_codon:yes stop_codon:yes gene_type:complete